MTRHQRWVVLVEDQADLNDEHARPSEAQPPPRTGMPKWVKVSLLVILALVVVFVIANATGIGGEHGPQRHRGSDGTPSTVVDDDGGLRPPVDHTP